MNRIRAALAVAIFVTGSATEQVMAQQVGELVVTAEKRNSNMQAVLAIAGPPHVVLIHRADNLVVEVQVDCDTRDEKDRLGEMKSTLRNMIGAAGASGGQIELGVESEGVILQLKPDALDTMLSPGQRDDTTTTTIVVKTHVSASDTFEAATARIVAFVQKTQVVGRTQLSRGDEWQLTLISPGQYHPQIVTAIAQDANDTVKAVGPGYGFELNDLERPVAWSRAGPLDLALYIPYTMKIEPLPGR
jgi:hypothetical protein